MGLSMRLETEIDGEIGKGWNWICIDIGIGMAFGWRGFPTRAVVY